MEKCSKEWNKKKNNSEIINIIILNFNIIFKIIVWFPKNILSRIISRNHNVLIKITFNNMIKIKIKYDAF